MSDRAERLALQLRRELSELVSRSVKDPRVQAAALVTVTHVRLSPDLGVADVMVSVVGGDAEGVVRALGRAAGFLRGELLRRLRTKKAPSLRFHIDSGVDHAEKIDSILKEIHAGSPVAEERAAADGAAADDDNESSASDSDESDSSESDSDESETDEPGEDRRS